MFDFYRRAVTKIDKIDVDQGKELLVSAVEQISLLETVINSIDVGILVCDENNNLVLVNKFAQRILPLNEVEGVELWDAIRDVKIVDFLREILLSGERATDREIDIEQQGRSRLLSVNVVPFVQDRKIAGSLIYIEDITEKRRGEERLRRAENLASLTTIAAGVAHEIKNPLGSISIYIQLLQKAFAKINKTPDANIEKYFNVIKEEVGRLNQIVVDFLFAVRPMSLELREGEIDKLITQIVEFVRFEMEQSKIQCNVEIEESLPKILMDEKFMRQALLNLVNNARAAMPEGGRLTIGAKCEENVIIISISDTGMGIKEENISKIFEPYFTTKETGTGLGLTQVFKIIREHQGEISVLSRPGEGTTFEIILPVPRRVTRMIAYEGKEAEQ